jgi:hypothetical protein
MDNLTYAYAAGTNRLRHISDAVAAGSFATDIDNQQADNYAYDANGSMQRICSATWHSSSTTSGISRC